MTDILKLLSKPGQFTGKQRDWKAWHFSFMAYLGAFDIEMVREAKHAMRSKTAVMLTAVSQEQQRISSTLFSFLVQQWKKRALLLRQMSEDESG